MEHKEFSPDIVAIELIMEFSWFGTTEFWDCLNALQMLRNFLLKTVTWTVAVNRHGRVGDSRVVCHWKDKFPASRVYNVKSNKDDEKDRDKELFWEAMFTMSTPTPTPTLSHKL